MKKIELDDNTLATVRQMYQEQGCTLHEVAQFLNFSDSQTEHILRKYGIKKTIISPEIKWPIDIIYQKYVTENKSLEDIADEIDCPLKTLKYLVYDIYKITKPKDKLKEFLREQSMQKYGVPCAAWSDSARQSRINTNIEKYGAENVGQNDIIKTKIRATSLERYGVDNYSKTPECRSKVEATNLKKYGVKHCLQNEELKNKARQTCADRYGVLNYKQINIPSESLKITSDKEHMEEFLVEHPGLTIADVADILNLNYLKVQRCVKNFGLQEYCKMSPGVSHGEKEVREFIQELTSDMVIKDRTILGNGQEIDIFSPSHKIGIEFNGVFWHSYEWLSHKGLDGKKYHYNKTKLAAVKGIRLIHIYEYEWNDPQTREIIKSLLKIAFGQVQNRIFARKCEIRQITNAEAKLFNNMNHLQGHRNAQVTYGLFYKDQLVQLMSFSKTKYNKNLKTNNSWEIIRGCPGSNNIVIGGVSKLFTHFIKEYEPDFVFSYCDWNKFDGSGYEAIGMKYCGETGPDMKWILSNNNVVYRNPRKHKQLEQIAKGRIYGAGSKKYMWSNNKKGDN